MPICPIMPAGLLTRQNTDGDIDAIKCHGSKCAMWLQEWEHCDDERWLDDEDHECINWPECPNIIWKPTGHCAHNPNGQPFEDPAKE